MLVQGGAKCLGPAETAPDIRSTCALQCVTHIDCEDMNGGNANGLTCVYPHPGSVPFWKSSQGQTNAGVCTYGSGGTPSPGPPAPGPGPPPTPSSGGGPSFITIVLAAAGTFVFVLFLLVVVKRCQQQQLRARQLAAGMREPMLADNGAGGAVPQIHYGAVPDAVLAEGPVNPNLYGGEGDGNGNDLIPQAREVSGDVRVDVNRNHLTNGSYQQAAGGAAANGGYGGGHDAERKAEEAQEAQLEDRRLEAEEAGQAAAVAVRQVNQCFIYDLFKGVY